MTFEGIFDAIQGKRPFTRAERYRIKDFIKEIYSEDENPIVSPNLWWFVEYPNELFGFELDDCANIFKSYEVGRIISFEVIRPNDDFSGFPPRLLSHNQRYADFIEKEIPYDSYGWSLNLGEAECDYGRWIITLRTEDIYQLRQYEYRS